MILLRSSWRPPRPACEAMQFEERQKTDCGSAPRKWNGTKGGHPKHRRRTKSIRSSQSILCRIFFPIEFPIEFLIEFLIEFPIEGRSILYFPETGRKAIHKSKKVSGGDKGPPQAFCSDMRAETSNMSCPSEGERGTAAVCWRKHAAAKPHAPDRSIPGKTPSRAL